MERAVEDPQARFARLEREIAEARRRYAALRHDGERHFIDEEQVSADVAGTLRDIMHQSDELLALRSMTTGSTAVNRSFTAEEVDAQHRQLDALEERIQHLATILGDDPHSHERHFIDG